MEAGFASLAHFKAAWPGEQTAAGGRLRALVSCGLDAVELASAIAQTEFGLGGDGAALASRIGQALTRPGGGNQSRPFASASFASLRLSKVTRL